MTNKKVNKHITREHLEKDIKMKSSIIENARRQLRIGAAVAVVFILLAFWSFSGYVDPLFPNINETVRTVVKVLSVIGLVLSTAFVLIYFNGIGRSRKLLLEEIDYYESMDKKKRNNR